jgi:hypothetical protein
MRSAGNFSPEWGYLAPAPSFLRTARVVLVATAVGATAGAAVVLSLVDRPAADATKTQIAAHAIVTSVHATPAAAVTPSAPAPVAALAVPGKVTAPADAKAPDVKPPDVKADAKPQISMPAQAVQDRRAEAPAQFEPPPVMAQPVTNASVPAVSPTVSPPVATLAPATAPALGPAAASVPAGAAGMAALSATPVAVSETATSDAPDLTITAPEPALPQKKAKHAAKPKSEPGLGSVLKHLFSASANKQSVH